MNENNVTMTDEQFKALIEAIRPGQVDMPEPISEENECQAYISSCLERASTGWFSADNEKLKALRAEVIAFFKSKL